MTLILPWMVCYLMQMLSAYSGTSPSTASMDASRMDVKMDKDPRRRSLKWPECPPYTRRSLRLRRSIRPSPAGVSARPATTSTRPRMTRLGCPDWILSGDNPESPPQPDTPVHGGRTLRPEAGLRALNGPEAHVSLSATFNLPMDRSPGFGSIPSD